jgi:hypothetical protein
VQLVVPAGEGLPATGARLRGGAGHVVAPGEREMAAGGGRYGKVVLSFVESASSRPREARFQGADRKTRRSKA